MLIWLLQWINIYHMMKDGVALMDEVNLLWICTGITFCANCYQVYWILDECKTILDIWIFSVKKKKDKTK